MPLGTYTGTYILPHLKGMSVPATYYPVLIHFTSPLRHGYNGNLVCVKGEEYGSMLMLAEDTGRVYLR